VLKDQDPLDKERVWPTLKWLAVTGLFGAAFMLASPALMVFSGAAALITVGLFVFVPLRAMLRQAAGSSGPPRPREE
jgi:hypothetical protein